MVNNLCKYCKLKTCRNYENSDGHCPEKLNSFLTDLQFNAKNKICNINYLINSLLINHDEMGNLTKRFFGCTPKIMLENVKLELAISSINSERDEYTIIDECGYEHIRTFKRTMKRRFGKTFSQIRSLITESEEPEKTRMDLINHLWLK